MEFLLYHSGKVRRKKLFQGIVKELNTYVMATIGRDNGNLFRPESGTEYKTAKGRHNFQLYRLGFQFLSYNKLPDRYPFLGLSASYPASTNVLLPFL